MKHLMASFICLISILSYSQEFQKLDEKNGFKTYTLGTNLSQYSNLNKVSQDGDRVVYSTSDTNNSIGDYRFKDLRLTFFNDKLLGVSFKINQEDTASCFGIFKTLFDAYGVPLKYEDIKMHVWDGNRVTLIYQSNGDVIDVTFLSSELKEMGKKIEEKKKEEAIKGL